VEQLRLLSRYTKNVFACFDGDDAGRKASLRALEIFLQAGLLGRGIFVPSGFDPDTLVRERGAASLEELIGASELLVDYFLKEQAREAKGSVAGRARAAEKVADLLKLVANPFEFDLLARKAAEMLGVGEDTLRKAARGISRTMRGERRIEMVKAPARLDAAVECELGLVAIALLHPTLRKEIHELCSSELFADAALATVFEEACAFGEATAGFDGFTGERLSEEQQSRIAELAVGPLVDDPASARKLAEDYILALNRRQTRREVDQLKRATAASPGPGGNNDDAVANVQAVIDLKRRDERERRNAS
jgi:DNA primase